MELREAKEVIETVIEMMNEASNSDVELSDEDVDRYAAMMVDSGEINQTVITMYKDIQTKYREFLKRAHFRYRFKEPNLPSGENGDKARIVNHPESGPLLVRDEWLEDKE